MIYPGASPTVSTSSPFPDTRDFKKSIGDLPHHRTDRKPDNANGQNTSDDASEDQHKFKGGSRFYKYWAEEMIHNENGNCPGKEDNSLCGAVFTKPGNLGQHCRADCSQSRLNHRDDNHSRSSPGKLNRR